MMVRHSITRDVYAMKILKKSELKRRKQIERTRTERNILAAVRHPFIVRLHYAFQTPHKLYMVMDFVQGGDFFTLMRKFRKLPESWAVLYVAEIAMALQHLHSLEIVYRDLKPENVLLTNDGHIKLTDFGLSRFFETRPPLPEDENPDEQITRSFCGTEQYMAPEMLLQQGHTYRVDWWCLGLLYHEMLTARHPFQGPSHYDTLRNMVSQDPLVDPRVSIPSRQLIRGLLIKSPKRRLGCRGRGLDELKSLDVFGNTDWEKLYNKEVAAPYVPDVTTDDDFQNFEATFTNEHPVDSVVATSETTRGSGLMTFLGFGSKGDASKQEEKKKQREDSVFDGFSFQGDAPLESDEEN
jgi:serine/threonine protein kinase